MSALPKPPSDEPRAPDPRDEVPKVAPPPAFGAFELTGVLGEGGSGTVYAVKRAGQSLALKVLRADLALSARERRRFLDEAERMRRLEHRSIVSLVDAGTLEDGRPFIAMPLLAGETLAARLDRGRLDAATVLRHFEDIAEAVATIHREGLIHRDIKPENVILGVERGIERCVLLDLGIARDVGAEASTTTEQGKIRGTRAYMAPERFFGVQASASTDIYELGVVLYLMLVGAPPWIGGDGAASRLRPRDPVELGVTMPEALRTTLLRALSTRPEMRPPSVEAFARDVRAAMNASVAGQWQAAAARTAALTVSLPPANENDAAARARPQPLRRSVAIGAGAFGLAVIVAFTATGRAKRTTPATVVATPGETAGRPPSTAYAAAGQTASIAMSPVASASAPALAAPKRVTTRRAGAAKSVEKAAETPVETPVVPEPTEPAAAPPPSASTAPERL